MEYLVSIFWIALELMSFILFYSAFLVNKRGCRKTLLSFLLIWGLMCLYSNSSIDEVVKQLVSVSVLVGTSLYLFDGHWIVHIILTITGYIFSGIMDTVILYSTSAIMGISLAELVWKKLFYITIVSLGKLIYLLTVWILCRFRKACGLSNLKSRWMLLTLLFPIVSTFILIAIFFEYQGNEDLSIGAVFISAVLAIANIAILYVIHFMEKATLHEKEMVLIKQKMELQKENISALDASYRIQRQATHEFHHHIQTLRDLLAEQEYATAYEYVQQIQSNRTLRIFSVNSNHKVIDVILNQKYQLAREYNIKMQVQVNDLSEIMFQTDILVVLLSNLLDNAIEACLKVDGRKEIICSILCEDCVYISIRNTSLPTKIINGEIASTKTNTGEHGYGIPAIRYILDQLDSEYTFDYRNGWFHFVAEIKYG